MKPMIGVFCAGLAFATSVRIENNTGNVNVRVVMGIEGVQVFASSPARQVRSGDVQYGNAANEIVVRCDPDDNARIDVTVVVPHSVTLEATTVDGAISVSGLLSYARLITSRGDIKIATSWQLMRLVATSSKAPREVVAPAIPGVEFVNDPAGVVEAERGNGRHAWTLLSSRRLGYPPDGPLIPDRRMQQGTFGQFRIEAKTPGRLELIDLSVPADSRVLQPFNAPSILEEMLQPARKRAPSAGTEPARSPALSAASAVSGAPANAPLFVHDVRLVTLSVAVHDRDGRPVTGLKPEEFEVVEDGTPQSVAFLKSEEEPFNLVLFLDLSGSTANSRQLMLGAALDFLAVTRPSDRVAVHALANTLFHVALPLTHDRKRLLSLIGTIPDLTGWTPLYDSLVLSCAQESLYRMQERSALVILTDGRDNRLEAGRYGSKVSFSWLRDAAAEWPILMYPIVVGDAAAGPNVRYASHTGSGAKRMQQLADATGGRLFRATSLKALAPVYAQVAEELRSVYSVGYYPSNQNFDGMWRRIQVRLKRSGALPRTRRGYFAW